MTIMVHNVTLDSMSHLAARRSVWEGPWGGPASTCQTPCPCPRLPAGSSPSILS